MFRTPVSVIGLIGAAFLAGHYAPDMFSLATPAQSQNRSDPIRHRVVAAGKSDRLTPGFQTDERMRVTTVELVGVSQATVILRDRNGDVLYRSDPQVGSTTYAKNTELPIVTLKEDMQGPAVMHPVSRQEGREVPADDQRKKRRPTVGCVGDVSPLVRASADRTPSLCLALLDSARS